MNPWKRRFLLKTIIFRFHVSFWKGTSLKTGSVVGKNHLKKLPQVWWQKNGDESHGIESVKYHQKNTSKHGECMPAIGELKNIMVEVTTKETKRF